MLLNSMALFWGLLNTSDKQERNKSFRKRKLKDLGIKIYFNELYVADFKSLVYFVFVFAVKGN